MSDQPINPASIQARLTRAILDAVGNVPDTEENRSPNPHDRARQIASASAVKAAVAAGALAAPSGLAGMVTLIPELMAIWRIQTQMVADIAATYGQSLKLTREQMIYCLFKATAAQAVGTLVVTVGESVLFRPATLLALQAVARKIGVKVTQKLLSKSIARWLPIVGALGVGAYTYYETGQVAQTAIDLFEKSAKTNPPETEKPAKAKVVAQRKVSQKSSVAGEEKAAKSPIKRRVSTTPRKSKISKSSDI